MRNHQRDRLNGLCALLENTVLLLVCSLPFLVPLSFGRNFDLQGLVIILTGFIAWTAVILRWKKPVDRYTIFVYSLVGVYIMASFINLITNFSAQNILGTPLYRLGSLGLIACVGCGLALRHIDAKRLIKWLYATIFLVAVSAVPYSLIVSNDLNRFGGVFSQANILAAFMGVGVLLGVALWQDYPTWRKYIIPAQVLMIAILIGTQTRSIIILVPVILLLIIFRQPVSNNLKLKLLTILVSLIVLIAGVVWALPSSRLVNPGYANASIQYRLDLQNNAIKSTVNQPIFGYGADGIENALPCRSLDSAALKQTCSEGYYFTSSHNIYLDRILAVGWLGGFAYLLLVVSCLYKGLRSSNKQILILSYCALLMALYYLTNITSIALELLFLILVLRISRS